MKKLSQHLKQALAALATADAGEMLSRRQMARVLQGQAGPAVPPRRQVALWAGATPSKAVLDYALAACKRLDAGLAVLHAPGKDMACLRAALGAGDFHSTALGGRPEAAVRHYIATHSQVAFLVLDGDDATAQLLAQRAGNPGVPMVLVAGERTSRTTRSSSHTSAMPALG